MFANIANAGGSALGDYTSRILAEYARRRGNGSNGGNNSQHNGYPFYSADTMEAKYLEVFGGRAGGSGRKYSDADRKNRLADDARRQRTKALVRLYKADAQHKADAQRKVTHDRRLPPINRSEKGNFETAIHESGHAISAAALGCECKHATIVPSAVDQGHVAWGSDYLSRKDAAVMTLAGPISQAFWAGEKWQPGSYGDDTDLPQATRHYDLNSAEFHSIKLESEALVRKHWPAILECAEELVQHRTLLGSDVVALVAAHQTSLVAA